MYDTLQLFEVTAKCLQLQFLCELLLISYEFLCRGWGINGKWVLMGDLLMGVQYFMGINGD